MSKPSVPGGWSAAWIAAMCWAIASPSASAFGLWDAGLRNAGWRSDFDDPLLGTFAAPLEYQEPCAYPGIRFALCPTTFRPLPGVDAPPTWFSRSNWRDERNDEQGRFWVVGANTEPALHAPCNSGPPNQSEAIALPNEDVYGLDIAPAGVEVRPARSVLRMALDLRHRPAQLAERPDCVPFDFIPYLGYGVDAGRGAGAPALALIGGTEPEVVWKFSARLESSDAEVFDRVQGPPAQPKGQHAGVWIEAQWGGHRRWVWIELFNTYELAEATHFSPWNWAVPQSFHFPGAEIVITSGHAIAERCPGLGAEIPSSVPAVWNDAGWQSVRLPLDGVFRCLGDFYSTDYPQNEPVMLTGLHFWVEVGVRDIDGINGLSVGDYVSHLTMAFSDVDLLPEGLPVLDDAPSLVHRLYLDLLLRSPGVEESQTGGRMVEQEGAVALIDALVGHRESVRSLGLAARLQMLAWGGAQDFELLNRHAAQLAQVPAGRLLSDELVRDPRFSARWGSVWDDAAVLDLLRAAHDPGDESGRRAQETSARQWSARLRRGMARESDLLWHAVQESLASTSMQDRARIVQAYAALLRRIPEAWEVELYLSDVERFSALSEDLFWSGEFRARFLPTEWSDGAGTSDPIGPKRTGPGRSTMRGVPRGSGLPRGSAVPR